MKEINYEQYLTALGLWTLHQKAREKCDSIEDALAELLEVPDGGSRYYGHLSDALYDGNSLDGALKKLNIARCDINVE